MIIRIQFVVVCCLAALMTLSSVTDAFTVAVFCNLDSASCNEHGSTNAFVASNFDALYNSRREGDSVFYLPRNYTILTEAHFDNISTSLSGVDHIVITAPAHSLIAGVFRYRRNAGLPRINMTIVDPVDQVDEALVDHAQVIFMRDDELGYLAGVVAGITTKTGHVGIVAGKGFLALRNIRSGFHQGVLQVCKACVIDGVYMSSFSNTAEGIANAYEMMNDGADVIFAPAGSAGTETILHIANTSNVSVIGVDKDEFYSTFNAGDGEYHKASTQLLTSAVKNTTVGVLLSVMESRSGSFHPGTRIIGAAQDGILLAPCHNSCHRQSEKSQKTIKRTLQSIKKGLISTNVDASKAQVLSDRLSNFPLYQNVPLRAASSNVTPAIISTYDRIVFLDGNWSRLSYYDPLSVMLVSTTTTHSTLSTTLTELPIAVTVSEPFTFIFLFGGVHDEAPSSAAAAAYWSSCKSSMCTTSPAWLEVVQTGNVPTPRKLHSMVSFHNKVVVSGGIDSSGNVLADVYTGTVSLDANDVLQVAWTKLECTLARPRHSHTTVEWHPPSDFTATYTAHTTEEGSGPSVAAGMAKADDHFVVFVGGDSDGPPVVVLHLEGQQYFALSLDDVEHDGRDNQQDALTLPIRQANQLNNGQGCVLLQEGQWRVTILTPSFTLHVNLATGKQSLFALPLTATNPLWPSEPLVLSYPSTCAVQYSSSPAHVSRTDDMTDTGTTSATSAAPHHSIYVHSSAAQSTNDISRFVVKALLCDASALLYAAADMSHCTACNTEIEFGECRPEQGSSTDTGEVLLFTVIPSVFLLGALVGGFTWYVALGSAEDSLARAPKKGSMGIGFFTLVDTTSHWRKEPQTMGRSVEKFRRIVSKAVKKFGACEVRYIADAHLVVAHSPMEIIRAGKEVLHEMNTTTWEGTRLHCVVAVHFGIPVVQYSEASGYDYVGQDVDNLIAFSKLFSGSKLLLSNEALEQTSTDQLELPDFMSKIVTLREGSLQMRINYTSLGAEGDMFSSLIAAPSPSQSQAGDSSTTGKQSSSGSGTLIGSDGVHRFPIETIDNLLSDAALAEHPHVMMGIITVAECRRLCVIVLDTITAAMAPMALPEQLALRRSLKEHLRITEDDPVRIALSVLQYMDIIELRLLLEQFYNVSSLRSSM